MVLTQEKRDIDVEAIVAGYLRRGEDSRILMLKQQ
jgi:hypothetical protein